MISNQVVKIYDLDPFVKGNIFCLVSDVVYYGVVSDLPCAFFVWAVERRCVDEWV